MDKEINEKFFNDISDFLHTAQKQVKTAVNLSMVYTILKLGRKIHEEQKCRQSNLWSATYKRFKRIKNFGKGYSVGNLKNIRQFYRVYSED